MPRYRELWREATSWCVSGAYIERRTNDMVHDWIRYKKYDMLAWDLLNNRSHRFISLILDKTSPQASVGSAGCLGGKGPEQTTDGAWRHRQLLSVARKWRHDRYGRGLQTQLLTIVDSFNYLINWLIGVLGRSHRCIRHVLVTRLVTRLVTHQHRACCRCHTYSAEAAAAGAAAAAVAVAGTWRRWCSTPRRTCSPRPYVVE